MARMADEPLLDLQGAVMNCILDFECISDLVHECVSRITLRHYQVNGQCAFCRAEAPDVQIVYIGYTGLAPQIGIDSRDIDVRRYCA